MFSYCKLFQASEKTAHAQKWAEPHLEIVKSVSLHYHSPLFFFIIFVFLVNSCYLLSDDFDGLTCSSTIDYAILAEDWFL